MFAKSALRSIARSVPAASRPSTASVLPSAFLRSSSRISSASPSSLLSRSYVSPAPTDSEEAIAADKGELEGEPTVEGAGKQEQAAPVDAKKFKEMEDKLEAQSKKVAELTVSTFDLSYPRRSRGGCLAAGEPKGGGRKKSACCRSWIA
jgi:hypothetical protein